MSRQRPNITVLVPDALTMAEIVGELVGRRQLFTAEPVEKPWPGAWLLGIVEENSLPTILSIVGASEARDIGTVGDVTGADVQVDNDGD